MTRQLRPEVGGDPTFGPVDELAANAPADRDLEADLVPDANRPGRKPARDQDRPDLDRFAERLGLRRHRRSGPLPKRAADGPNGVRGGDGRLTFPRAALATAASAASALLRGAGSLLERAADRIGPSPHRDADPSDAS